MSAFDHQPPQEDSEGRLKSDNFSERGNACSKRIWRYGSASFRQSLVTALVLINNSCDPWNNSFRTAPADSSSNFSKLIREARVGFAENSLHFKR
jgi:hypothetical protein